MRGHALLQRSASLRGLERLADLDSYCYHVAGVVGEMLTELFCAYSPEIDAHAAGAAAARAVLRAGTADDQHPQGCVGGPQPRGLLAAAEVFERRGFDLERLPARHEQSFGDSLRELVGIAHGHLRNALSFTLLIPASETGIRRFCPGRSVWRC